MDAVSSAPVESMKWYEVWRKVFLHPSANTFDRILADPTATPRRAYAWVAIISALISIFGQIFSPDASILRLIFYMIFVPILSLFGLAFNALILHWVAKRYHGQGSYNRMVYVLSAIIAPFSIIDLSLNTVLSSLEPLYWLVSFILAIFMIYLQVQAIKAAERITTSEAFWTSMLPGLVLVALIFFVAIVLALLAPALGAGVG